MEGTLPDAIRSLTSGCAPSTTGNNRTDARRMPIDRSNKDIACHRPNALNVDHLFLVHDITEMARNRAMSARRPRNAGGWVGHGLRRLGGWSVRRDDRAGCTVGVISP